MSPLRIRVLRHLLLVAACLAALAPAAARAQGEVRPGVRVRVLAPSAADTLFTGRVVALDSASLLIAPGADAGSLRVPLAEVRQIEVSRGRARATLAGAVSGGFAGAAGGYVLARLAGGGGPCEYVCGAAEAGSAILGGAIGLVVGALIGSDHEHGPERWRGVPVPAAAP